ncbi:PucR family transcriptional regulator [Pseudonocardiaceae bacterium YIM PH 21723]|nr:PucR family transcriptional regulator [Pseudonocardiaceae bacterium YIM PH 21723]
MTDLLKARLGNLAEEIIREIRQAIPEYAWAIDGGRATGTRLAVEQAIATYLDQLTDPGADTRLRDAMCRRLGRGEAYQGRSLDVLQSAYRLAGRIAWRQVMALRAEGKLPAEGIAELADALMEYVDEITAVSQWGYNEAQLRLRGTRLTARRRLLHLLLERPAPSAETMAGEARALGWTVPNEVTLIAVHNPDGMLRDEQVPLDEPVLVDLRPGASMILVPGQVHPDTVRWLGRVLHGAQLAVGATVPPSAAWASLRWANRALQLVRDGALPDRAVTWVDENLAALWLHADPLLTGRLADRRLAPLLSVPVAQREKLAETLLAWLQTHGSAPELSVVLAVHPQTVRHRLRRLKQLFGAAVYEPQAAFELLIALRARGV